MRIVLVNRHSGEVINMVEGDSGFDPGDALLALEAAADVAIGDYWDGKAFHKREAGMEVVSEVSDMQFRLALSARELRERVEVYIEDAPAETRDFWDRALVVPRHHWFIEEVMRALKLGESEIDALFQSAKQF